MGRKPSGQAPHLRNHNAVLSRNQGDYAPSRKPVFDDFGKMLGTEEFGDVAMDRGEAVIGCAFEQLRVARGPEHFRTIVAALVQSEIILVRLAAQREPGRPRNQLNGTESPSGVEELVGCRWTV